MIIDGRATVDRETADAIDAAADALSMSMDSDGRPDRNTVRRYYRLIRRTSGLARVTTHHCEHNPAWDAPTVTIAFGRGSR